MRLVDNSPYRNDSVNIVCPGFYTAYRSKRNAQLAERFRCLHKRSFIAAAMVIHSVVEAYSSVLQLFARYRLIRSSLRMSYVGEYVVTVAMLLNQHLIIFLSLQFILFIDIVWRRVHPARAITRWYIHQEVSLRERPAISTFAAPCRKPCYLCWRHHDKSCSSTADINIVDLLSVVVCWSFEGTDIGFKSIF